MLECAEGLAGRMIAAGNDPAERIALGFELAWGRTPEPREISTAPSDSSATPPAATTDRDAWTSLAKVLLTANEFLYID